MKKVLISLGVFIALVVVIVSSLGLWLTPERVKTSILPTLSDALGREVKINGDIGLELFPNFGISLEQVSVANAPKMSPKHMVNISKVDVAIAVLPLLGGSVEISQFILYQPEFFLIKPTKGEPNWVLGAPAPTPINPEQELPAAELPLSELRIGKVAIKNGRLSYQDRTSGDKQQINSINVELTMPTMRDLLTMSGQAKLNGQPVSGNLTLDSVAKLITGEATLLHVDASTPFGDIISEGLFSFNAPVLEAKLTQINFASPTINIAGTGIMQVIMGSTRPEIKAKLNLNHIDFEDIKTAPTAEAIAKTPTPIIWPEEPLNIGVLAAADTNINIIVDSIHISGKALGPLKTNILLQNKLLTVTLKEFDIFGGSITGKMVANGRNWPLSGTISYDIENINGNYAMPESLKPYGISSIINGTINLETQGRSIKTLMDAMAGSLEIKTTEIGVANIEPKEFAQQQFGELGPIVASKISPEMVAFIKDRVTTAAVMSTIEKGVAATTISFAGPVLQGGGKGPINLSSANISLNMKPTLKGAIQDITLPFFIRGPFNDIAIKPNKDAIAKEVIKQTAKSGAKKILQKAAESGSSAMGVLGGIIKNITNTNNTEPTEDTPPQEEVNPVKDLQKALGGFLGK